MFCQRCGQHIKDGSNYCQYCGARTGGPIDGSARWDAYHQRSLRYSQSASKTGANQNVGLVSLVCGILGTVFFWLIVPGFILGIMALIFGITAQLRLQSKKGRAVAGIILGIAALALAVWMIAAAMGGLGLYLNHTQMELNYI